MFPYTCCCSVGVQALRPAAWVTHLQPHMCISASLCCAIPPAATTALLSLVPFPVVNLMLSGAIVRLLAARAFAFSCFIANYASGSDGHGSSAGGLNWSPAITDLCVEGTQTLRRSSRTRSGIGDAAEFVSSTAQYSTAQLTQDHTWCQACWQDSGAD